jgi:hypothetical protein
MTAQATWTQTFDVLCTVALKAALDLLDIATDAEMRDAAETMADYLAVGDVDFVLEIMPDVRECVESVAVAMQLDAVQRLTAEAAAVLYA